MPRTRNHINLKNEIYPIINIRVKATQRTWIDQQARAAGLTRSRWIKHRILRPEVTYNPILELQQIISALNQAEPDARGARTIAATLIAKYAKLKGFIE